VETIFKTQPAIYLPFWQATAWAIFSTEEAVIRGMQAEQQLLLLLIRVQPGTAGNRSIKKLIDHITDWSFFLQLCQYHGLQGIISKRITQHYPDLFPPVCTEKLHSLFFSNAMRSMSFTRTLIQILDLFSQNALSAIPFKGPLLASQLYGEIGLRNFCDLDILIKKQDLRNAIHLLASHGFIPEIENIAKHADFYSKQEDNLSLSREKDGCIIELHWDMAGCYLAEDITFSDVDSASRASLAGKTVQCLDTDDLLIYLCVHGTKHIWERLEWLYSVATLLENSSDLNWHNIQRRADNWQCQRMLLLGLQLSHELLGAGLPDEIHLKIAKDPRIHVLVSQVKSTLFPPNKAVSTQKDSSRFSMFHLLVRNNLLESMSYGLRLLFRPTVKEWQAWLLPGRLSFLYYGFRPFRLGWMLVKDRVLTKIN
jgi:putative nucleotidyltransferase-like protein